MNTTTRDRRVEAAAGVPGPGATATEKLAWVERQRAPLDARGKAILRGVFAVVMHAYYDWVRRRIAKWRVDAAVAEDIFQEVFLELFERVTKQGVQPNLPGMIGRITKGRLLHHVRDLRNAPETVAIPSSGSAPAESVGDVDRAVDYRALAQRLLDELSPFRRAVVELCILADKSDVEAALALGIKEGTLKTALAAARRELLALGQRLLPKSQRLT